MPSRLHETDAHSDLPGGDYKPLIMPPSQSQQRSDGKTLHNTPEYAESPHKATRETALTVIRTAYARVGSPDRLAWLMESPERDVRLFAVRLFWEHHKPQATREKAAFDDVAALRQFLRTVLYGLPPGRVERRTGPEGKNAPLPQRPLAASIGKRRLVEAIRDLGVEKAGFAQIVAPVLVEFTASEAKGEWQACVAALAALRAAHGSNLAQEITA